MVGGQNGTTYNSYKVCLVLCSQIKDVLCPKKYLHQRINLQIYLIKFQKKQRNQRSNCQHPLDHRKSNIVPEKHLLLLDCAKAFDRVGHNKLWKTLKRDGNTRPPFLPVKHVHKSRINSQNRTWKNGLVPNWERSISRLNTVTLLI